MSKKTLQIMEESWDYLILLDACRYDYFEQIWRTYLPEGDLSCRESVGGCTLEWRDRSFPDRYEDVVYISSNPYINSQKAVEGFLAKDHFFQVVDLWQYAWDKTKGTVLPEIVTQEALRALSRYPEKRMIIHYLQPHAPYLGFGSDCEGFPLPDVDSQRVLRGTVNEKLGDGVRKKLYRKLYPWVRKWSFPGNHPDWVLAQMLGLPPQSPMDAVRRRYGKQGLRKAYQQNLERVLREVANLLRYLSGLIVITSDHGELLGEKHYYSHESDSKSPFLRDVPWWSFRKERAVEIPDLTEPSVKPARKEGYEIQRRLRDLGYL